MYLMGSRHRPLRGRRTKPKMFTKMLNEPTTEPKTEPKTDQTTEQNTEQYTELIRMGVLQNSDSTVTHSYDLPVTALFTELEKLRERTELH